MRNLTYTVTTDKGSVHAGIRSYDEARELISREGGHMVAVMKNVPTEHIPATVKVKRVRPKATAPIE
jgi:hypothetical protein